MTHARSVARFGALRALTGLLTVAALGVSALATAPPVLSVTTVWTPPVPPATAPAVVEGFSPYLPQVSCDPVIKPGALSFRTTMMAAYGGRDLGISRACTAGGRSEHKEGRAWDWGLDATNPEEKAAADAFLTWLIAPGPDGTTGYHARRLGIMYVIYNGRIWGSYRAAEGWRSYTGGESHGSHLHVSFAWTGAMARTSWWTGNAAPVDYGPCVAFEGADAPTWSAPRATPCAAPQSTMTLAESPLLARGAEGPYVTQLQRLLAVSPVTGFFGPLTQAAVSALQTRAGLPVTGTTTPETWTAARAAPTAAPPVPAPPAPAPPQPAPKPVVSPVTSARALPAQMAYRVRPGDSLSKIAKRWRSTVDGIRTASSLTSDTLRVRQVLQVPVRSGITKFTWTKLRRGDKGVAVRALQSAMRMRPKYRTGLFGPITQRRVNKLKARRGWAADGVAGPGIWRALGA